MKLICPRSGEGGAVAQDLWTTHAAINEATRYYEGNMLLMRGEEYGQEDGIVVPREEVQAGLRKMVDEARARNGAPPVTSGEFHTAAQLLRKMYEAIVPSSVGGDGDAQAANAYISPLTDPESRAFLAIFDKLETPPAWVEDVRSGAAGAIEQASEWIQTNEGKARLRPSGSPPTWIRKYRRGDADWPQAFVADQDRKTLEVSGVPTIIKALREMKVLPLFNSCLASRIEGAQGILTPWDRLAFRLTAAHLLSWESWCKKTIEEYDARAARLDEFRSRFLDKPEHKDLLAGLGVYEQERSEELARVSLKPVRPFRIRRRMVRSWPDLREKWKRSKDNSPKALMAIAAAEQARLRGRFGDPDLFRWLSRPERHTIWRHDSDILSLYADFNFLKDLLERSRQHATMTLPDPILHPRSVQWEPRGGRSTNLRSYGLTVRDRKLIASLPLLSRSASGGYVETEHDIPVAPTRQFLQPLIAGGSAGVAVEFRNQAGELFSGTLRSADLLLDWNTVFYRQKERLEQGDFGPAYLKVVVEIEPNLPEGCDGKFPKAVNHFTCAIGNNKYASAVFEGLRVLSVDLGIRSFAACSVFQLSRERTTDSVLQFQVDGGFWALHERSFLLKLPGEERDNRADTWRADVRAQLGTIRRCLNRHRAIYRLAAEESEARGEKLAELKESIARTPGFPEEEKIVADLAALAGAPQDAWRVAVDTAKEQYRARLGAHIGAWRSATGGRQPGKVMGKTVWAIDHLTDIRRTLMGWSLLGESSGDIRRQDREKRGIFGANLLRHLDNMKDDRIKTGSDLIVQAARGYLREQSGKWARRYEPCHAVLFEDLTRYRMKTDRPRRENSQLMLWSHRQIPEQVKMQGELYGIHTCDTGAAFSSRYSAMSMTPGVRCRSLRAGDLEDPVLRAVIEEENPGIRWDALRPGRLVPLSGGEILAYLSNGGVANIHADVNAAQQLQRRFWTRHGEAFRLPCVKVRHQEAERWLPKSFGKRLAGALGGSGWLVPTGHESGSCRWEKTKARPVKTQKSDESGQNDRESALLEDIEEQILETSGEVMVFFRDPSGFVLPAELWYPSKVFWSIVKAKTGAALFA